MAGVVSGAAGASASCGAPNGQISLNYSRGDCVSGVYLEYLEGSVRGVTTDVSRVFESERRGGVVLH